VAFNKSFPEGTEDTKDLNNRWKNPPGKQNASGKLSGRGVLPSRNIKEAKSVPSISRNLLVLILILLRF